MNRSLSSFFRLDETFIYSVFEHSGRFIVDPEITVDAIFKQYDEIDKFYIFDCAQVRIAHPGDPKLRYNLRVHRKDTFASLLSSLPENAELNYRNCKIFWGNQVFGLADFLSDDQIMKLSKCDQEFEIVPFSQLIELGPINEEARAAFMDYERMSRVLYSNNLFEDIIKVIESAWEITAKLQNSTRITSPLNAPFISIVEASYSGKTQFTMALDKYSQHPLVPFDDNDFNSFKVDPNAPLLVVIRFVMQTDVVGQDIYSAHSDFSNAFIKAIDADIELLKTELQLRNTEVFLSGAHLSKLKKKLHTVGLIVRLINARVSGEDINCFSKELLLSYALLEISKGRQKIQELTSKNQGKSIVVTLDEFNFGSDASNKKLMTIFARYVLRELGIVTIVLGADSRAVSLIVPENGGGASREKGSDQPWCYLISRLPRATQHTLSLTHLVNYKTKFKDRSDFDRMYSWISSVDENLNFKICENPGILKLFVNELVSELDRSAAGDVETSALLRSVFASARRKIVKAKALRKMTSANLYEEMRFDITETYPSESIHEHFYNLNLENASNFSIDGKNLYGVYEINRSTMLSIPNDPRSAHLIVRDNYSFDIPFEPRSRLPTICKNELLYWILLDPKTGQFVGES